MDFSDPFFGLGTAPHSYYLHRGKELAEFLFGHLRVWEFRWLYNRIAIPRGLFRDGEVYLGRLGRGLGGPKSPNFPPKIGLLRGVLSHFEGGPSLPKSRSLIG